RGALERRYALPAPRANARTGLRLGTSRQRASGNDDGGERGSSGSVRGGCGAERGAQRSVAPSAGSGRARLRAERRGGDMRRSVLKVAALSPAVARRGCVRL